MSNEDITTEVVEGEIVDSVVQEHTEKIDESEIIDAEVVEDDESVVVSEDRAPADLIMTMCDVIPSILTRRQVIMRTDVAWKVFDFARQMLPHAAEFAERNPREDLASFLSFCDMGAKPFVMQLVNDFCNGMVSRLDDWRDCDLVLFTAGDEGIQVSGGNSADLADIAAELGADGAALMRWFAMTEGEGEQMVVPELPEADDASSAASQD